VRREAEKPFGNKRQTPNSVSEATVSITLVTGASGQLGAYLLQELGRRGRPAVAWSGSRTGELLGFPLVPVNIADRDALARAFRDAKPAVVIHAAALSRIDECFRDPAEAHRVNAEATAVLSELCQAARCRLVYVSTDLVFDGARGGYRESDQPAPLSVYGRTKYAAEQPVLAGERSAVVRSSLLFGPALAGRPGFFDLQLRALRDRTPLPLFDDEWRTPTSLPVAARTLLLIAAADFQGLIHMGGPERMSRWEMGQRLAAALGLEPSVFTRRKQADLPMPEPRPPDVSLDCRLLCETFPDAPRLHWEASLKEFDLD